MIRRVCSALALPIALVSGWGSEIALGQGYPPEESVARMTVEAGLKARLVASEPLVRQPVAIEFDDRGRLWVIQYLQYPNPEGLKRVEVDRYSRTRYDQVPPPPPKGPRGADRITILDDTNGDGRMDRSRDFVTGLNLATGLAFGYGGVFVLNVPYLLFYPDRDRDDRPDGDPEVLVSGFGMEDAHSVANSLTWGPDGWLYGLQGSTVTARINGIEFQQGVWRYHPVSRRFELFAEGGGNMWGLDFDRDGNLFASTNVGGNVMLHFVQGGYYWKQFGKHGMLHNPYAFGYFNHVKHEGVRGGHVAVGGLFYQADAWPERFRGKYLAADLLDHSAHWHEVIPWGSTFRARQLGDFLRANDSWFAPTDMTLGPDGSIYLSDWHDQRTAHPDPDADWDRSNGRIDAIDGPDRPAARPAVDLPSLPTPELIELLRHPNVWYVRKARRILAERRDPAAVPILRTNLKTLARTDRLEALWALFGCGGFDHQLARALLDDPDARMRAATIRLLGDHGGPVGEALMQRLEALAATEPSVTVRAQLACTAPRLGGNAYLIIARLAARDVDGDDPMIPLLLWWGLERFLPEPAAVDPFIQRPEMWRSRLYRNVLLGRLVQRLSAERDARTDAICRLLLSVAPDAETRSLLFDLLDQAFQGRPASTVSEALKMTLEEAVQANPPSPSLLRIAARLGLANGRERLRSLVADDHAAETQRLDAIRLLGEIQEGDWLDPLLHLATSGSSPAIRLAALDAVGQSDESRVATVLLRSYPDQSPAWRTRARSILATRLRWTKALLQAVDRGQIDPKELSIDEVAHLAPHEASFDEIKRKHWGHVTGPTPEEKLAEVRRLNNDLRAGAGDPRRGRELFRQHCSACHRLFGEGNLVGPELTFANRKDRTFLLVSLVDPNGVVRKEYQTSLVQLKDGRILTGLILDQSAQQLTLVSPNGERATVLRNQVEEIADSPGSLMPENLYRQFSPQQLRDLFSFIEED